VRGNMLSLRPCMPPSWPGFGLRYRFGRSDYHIVLNNPHGLAGGVVRWLHDGAAVQGDSIEMVDDGASHRLAGTLVA
jgi:cyclic beta-1,2-glucan synthetase